MKRALRISFLFVFLILAARVPASATVVANYTFTGNSLASSDTDVSSTASDVSIGAGLSGQTTFFSVFGNNCLGATSDNTPSTEAAAISANDYLSFTVTPSPGVPLAFNSLQFNFAFNGFLFPYTANVTLRWSADSFGSTLGTSTLTAFGNTVFQGEQITLNPALVQSGPVEFRLFLFDTQDSSFNNIGVTNLALAADLVPEPSSATLLLAGIVLIARRKR